MATSARRRSLVVGTLVAVVALLAAYGAAAAVGAMRDDDKPEVEAELEFLPADKEPPDALAGGAATGKTVSKATWEKLGAGGTGSFADYEGKPVVVNFFGSWCVPCRQEMPAFEEVFRDVGEDVAFLGLAVRDSTRDAKAFVKEMGTTYDIGRDTNGKLLAAFGGVQMPSTFLVSADGKVVAAQAGRLEPDELRELIATHLRT